jgi:glucan phosphorylase
MIIKLANDMAKRINSDPAVSGLLKVAFLPNYNVTLAEAIIPPPTCRSRFPPPAWKRPAPAT